MRDLALETRGVHDDPGRLETDQIGLRPDGLELRLGEHLAQIQQALPQGVAGGVFTLLGPQERRDLSPGHHMPGIESEHGQQRARLLALEEQDVGGLRSRRLEPPEKTDKKRSRTRTLPAHGGANLTHLALEKARSP